MSFLFKNKITDEDILKYLNKQESFKDAYTIFNNVKRSTKDTFELFSQRLLLLAGQHKILAVRLKSNQYMYSKVLRYKNDYTTLSGVVDSATYLLLSSSVEGF